MLPYFNLQEIKVKVESPKEKEEETLAKDKRLKEDVKYLSDASIKYEMKNEKDKEFEKLILYPEQVEGSTLMSKERLSKFATKYIDWDKIIDQIVKEARLKTKTTWGMGQTSGKSTSTQIKKMNFSEVKHLV